MGYSVYSASAILQIAGINNARDAALAVYDYLVNHPDEIPDCLDDGDSDEVVNEIESYLDFAEGRLIISYCSDGDSCNTSSEVFDFLFDHFVLLQVSLFASITWVNGNKSGYTAGTDYYDRSGNQIDICSVLTSHLSSDLS